MSLSIHNLFYYKAMLDFALPWNGADLCTAVANQKQYSIIDYFAAVFA